MFKTIIKTYNLKKLIFKISFFVIFFCYFFSSNTALSKVNKKNQSISVQIGVNGISNKTKSYGLQFIPPDIAYSHEIFDDDYFNISGGFFYDNIGVKIQDKNFSYRVGTRIDFGMELGKYTPYFTTGFATIRNAHNYQSSLIYGAGILKRLTHDFALSNEINFQNVHYQNSSFTIVNLSLGINYLF